MLVFILFKRNTILLLTSSKTLKILEQDMNSLQFMSITYLSLYSPIYINIKSSILLKSNL